VSTLMWRRVAIFAATCLVAGCGGTRHHTGPTPVAGGCGSTDLRRGGLPAWTAPAFAASGTRASPWLYAVSQRGLVVAIVFGYPLRAGNPTDPANKVLWIMRLPRHGSPLAIDARPLTVAAPLVKDTWPADSSPGEIYPSYFNAPRAGCWRLTLRWAHHVDSIDLRVKA
jgi:hypothetical protein